MACNSNGFYTFYNYGGAPGYGGTTRLGSGFRKVWAHVEGNKVRLLDWSTGDRATVDLRHFQAQAKPDSPRKSVVRRCLRGQRHTLAYEARNV